MQSYSTEDLLLSYVRYPDRENDTHCWGIYSTKNLLKLKLFSMMYFPQIITRKDTTITEDLVTDVVASLLKTIKRASWTDEYGVKFKNYGRGLYSANPILFTHQVKDYRIPDGGTTINEDAFCYTDIKSICIPASVRNLGDGCFHGCHELESITFAEDSRVRVIPENCFADCWSLRSIVLPQSVTYISEGAFSNCSKLTEVTANGKLEYIDNKAIDNIGSVFIKMKVKNYIDDINELKRRRVEELDYPIDEDDEDDEEEDENFD